MRTLEVELDRHASLIRGFGSRDLIERVTGRPPMRVSRLNGWSVQEKTARDVIAAAEADGWSVLIIGPRTRRQRLLDVLNAAPTPREFAGSYEGPDSDHLVDRSPGTEKSRKSEDRADRLLW